MKSLGRQRLPGVLAFAGVATAAASMAWVWSQLVSSGYPGPLWPLPGLYLLEAVLLPVVVLWRVTVVHRPGALAWVAIGALITMALLGAMTIGFYFALALVFMIPASLVGDDRQSTVRGKAAGAVLGAVLQGGLMIGVIRAS
jgi:hypothetical protein